MIDYRMQTFITLCELMNYRLTAEKLNMTQPAVTQHIKYLEKQYQTKLFIYDGKSLIKTEKAKCLEKSTRTMYMLEKELKVQMDEAKEDPIIMGATKTIAEFAVSKMILEYLNQTKQDFELVVDNTEHLLDKIDHGEIDFALIEGYFNKNNYAYQLLERQPFVGICSKDHPFAKKEVSMEEILKETILIREKGSGTRNILEEVLFNRNYSLKDFNRQITIGNFTTICDLIKAQKGITFAYQIIAKNIEQIEIFTIKDFNMIREFNYVYLPQINMERKIASFRKS